MTAMEGAGGFEYFFAICKLIAKRKKQILEQQAGFLPLGTALIGYSLSVNY